ncbi:LysR family transcriptional regulator [Bordetella bronchiseptica]|uniref:LysR family transcriptional regulator n=2 Tax=Bordetella bronchiseptica TaxID=518 RepID=UPI0011D2C449|nr:LysR substrate-binding domain-containing protein [Bordetella bronchiseptica]
MFLYFDAKILLPMKFDHPDIGIQDEAAGASALIRRLRMRHLELLVILASASTVRAAAARMRLTQPAVTRMLKEIEDMFGGALFDRSPRGITPNRLGLLLLDRAQVMMEEVRATEDELQLARQGQMGLLRIGTFSGSRAILQAVAELSLSDERLKIELHESQVNQLLDALLRNELDCVLGALPPDELRHERIDQLRLEQLAADTIDVVTPCGSVWSRKRRVRWEDLAHERWLLPPRDSLLRRAFVQQYLELGIAPPAPVVESLSPANMRTLIELQAGQLGLVRAEYAREEQRLGTLRIVPVTPRLALLPLIVFTRRRPRTRQALVDRFVRALRAAQADEGAARTKPGKAAHGGAVRAARERVR